jgi:carbamoyl-phosphate synthase large subunit
VVLETIRRALYLEKEISTYKVETLPKELLLEAKQKVLLTDKYTWCVVLKVSAYFGMTMNINRVFKLVDTCAAEFKANLYSTFEAEIEKRMASVM